MLINIMINTINQEICAVESFKIVLQFNSLLTMTVSCIIECGNVFAKF